MAFDALTDNSNVFQNMMEQLQASPTLATTNLVFGEENRFNLQYKLPYVVVYPTSETYQDNAQGYVKNLDPAYSIVWFRRVNLEFVLWSRAEDQFATSQAQADELNILIGNLLSAFRYNQSTLYKFLPRSSHWELFKDAKTRLGRSYVMNVVCDIPVLSPTPVFAEVTEVITTETIGTQV